METKVDDHQEGNQKVETVDHGEDHTIDILGGPAGIVHPEGCQQRDASGSHMGPINYHGNANPIASSQKSPNGDEEEGKLEENLTICEAHEVERWLAQEGILEITNEISIHLKQCLGIIQVSPM